MMQIVVLLLSVILIGLNQVAAAAVKPCEELKAAIAAKLDSKNVKKYELKIVAADSSVTEGKIVGRCEDGSKKIVYVRQIAQEQPPLVAAVIPSAAAQPDVPVVAVKMIPAAIRSCEEVKADIVAKLAEKGVTDYELTVTESDSAAAGKMVGSCENGSKQILYSKK